MSEAMRDYSEASGAILTCGFVFATYASADGSGVYPSLTTVMSQAKVSKPTAIRARRWFVDHGEAVITGTKPSHTGTPVPVLDFGPLLLRAKGQASSPSDAKGNPSSPFAEEGSPELTHGVVPVDPQGSTEETGRVAPVDPNLKGTNQGESEKEPEDAREDARDSGLSPASKVPAGPTPAQLAVERREDEIELQTLEAQLHGGRTFHIDQTVRSINLLRDRLDLESLDVPSTGVPA